MTTGLPKRMVVATLAAMLPMAPLPSQQPAPRPAPAAETARPVATRPAAGWSAEDAVTFRLLQQAAERVRAGDQSALYRLGGRQLPYFGDGSSALLGRAGTQHAFLDGQWVGARRPGQGPADWLYYSWPAGAGRRVFCLSSAGVVLSADNTAGYGEERQPEGAAATAGGTKGTFADLLVSPGKGRDGQMWEIAVMAPTRCVAVMVRDEAGQSLAGRLCLLPASWIDRVQWLHERERSSSIGLALPAGEVTTDAEGAGRLAGVPAEDLVACFGDEQMLLALPGEACRLDGETLIVEVRAEALRVARFNTNESLAIATLKNISSAQAQCQASAAIDANGNGAGEYGFFGELSGKVPVRKDGEGGVGDQTIAPPVLSSAFGRVEGGRVVRNGYLFQMFLPGPGDAPVAEADAGGGAGVKIAPDRAEVIWCCYAWPVEAAVTGQCVFFVNQGGDVLVSTNRDSRYSGAGEPIDPMAAFGKDTDAGLASDIAANRQGRDGQVWVVRG